MMIASFRPSRMVIILSATAFILLTLGILNHLSDDIAVHIPLSKNGLGGGSGASSRVHSPPQSQAHAITAAANATLGFHKILWINMKRRWDKEDALRLQSYVSGINVETFPAVDGKEDIDDAGRVGLAPSHGRKLKGGELACYRSHANIWLEMVEKRLPPVLIMESDAAWDVNLRAIMGLANQNLVEYLSETGSKPRNIPFYAVEVDSATTWPDATIDYKPDDPWLSDHWDILSLGHCNDQVPFHKDKHPDRAYRDRFAGKGGSKFTVPDGFNRVVRRSTGFACTTAYAVSHRGAAKMLHRHAQELNNPIDLIMIDMINKGDLISYTINPPPIAQWDYLDHIGRDQASNSDIHADDTKVDGGGGDSKEDDNSGWNIAYKKHSVWTVSQKYPGLTFKEPALEMAYDKIFKQPAQFSMQEIPGMGEVMAMFESPPSPPDPTATNR